MDTANPGPSPADAGRFRDSQAPDLQTYNRDLLDLYRLDGEPPPSDFGSHSLGTDDCPRWRQAIAPLAGRRDLLLSLGDELLEQGRHGEAMALYRWLVEIFPADALIVHNFGSLLKSTGDLLEAEAVLRQALVIDPQRQDSSVALAEILQATRSEEARGLLRRLDPEGPKGFAGLLVGLRLDLDEHPERAPALVDALLDRAESSPDRRASLLAVLVGSGPLALAIDLADRWDCPEDPLVWSLRILALLAPSQAESDAEAHELRRRLERERGSDPELWRLLGRWDHGAGRSSVAAQHLRRAMELGGARGVLRFELAEILFSLGQLQEARDQLEASLRSSPLQAQAWLTRGQIALGLGEGERSRPWFRVGLRLTPRCGKGFHRLASVVRALGDITGSLTFLREARRRRPDDARIQTDLGVTLLQLGAYPEGWQAYEARLAPSVMTVPVPVGLPRWDGQTQPDELILVAEQGIGDLIQFLRYVPFLSLSIPRVSILAADAVTSLLRHSGLFDQVFRPGERILVAGEAAWLPLLSLPALLGVSPECVLIEAPYLHAEPAAVSRWAARLREGMAGRDRLIGLHWQGNPATEAPGLVGRSLPLQALAPLATLPEVRFVSLQKGFGSEQLPACSFRDRFVAAQPAVDACWDFVETTALLQACDLVITSDSAIAHLAGALGRPVWLLLHAVPDWRWGLEGDSTPWYPTMRLFRQSRFGDWRAVVLRVHAALQDEPPTEEARDA